MAAAAARSPHDLPAGAVTDSPTYLAAKADVDRTASIFVPILLAFSVFSLLAAAFIIANVVSGIVLTGYRDIGVMKAVGYTPNQVVAILLAEILAPATIGAVIGVVAGTLASQPILAQTARSFGLPEAFTMSMPVIAGVLAAVLAVSVLAAVGPAVRAGRLSVTGAISRGSMPSLGGPAEPVPASRRTSLGCRRRSGWGSRRGSPTRFGPTMTLGALVVGVAALVFAVGLDLSLHLVAQDLNRDVASPIRVELGRPVLPAGPGHRRHRGRLRHRPVRVDGAARRQRAGAGPVPFVAYQGDATWIGYVPIEGRWFSGPGEAVAPTNFFTETGLHVGDQVTVGLNGRSVTVTLVGEIFDQARENQDDLVIRGDWADLAALEPGLVPDSWEVQPKAGISPEDYRSALGDATAQAANIGIVCDSSTDETFLLFEGVISTARARPRS